MTAAITYDERTGNASYDAKAISELRREYLPTKWSSYRRIAYLRQLIRALYDEAVCLDLAQIRLFVEGRPADVGLLQTAEKRVIRLIQGKLKELRHRMDCVKGEADAMDLAKWELMKERAHNVRIADEYSDIKNGMNHCVFGHKDKNPSLSVKNNLFNCFSCGAKGTTVAFMMKREGCTFADAVKRLGV